MSDDDPFAEPTDAERTVIRPNPGGRRPAAPPAAAPAPRAPGPAAQMPDRAAEPEMPGAGAPRRSADAAVEAGMTGMNPLNAAAATLFSLVSRIRNRAQHMDPDALRRSVMAEVRAFESRAVEARVDPADLKVARYAICATLDDVVLNTPWGGASSWAQQSMVGTFHRETVGGDRFYDLLARLEQDPAKNIMLLEFLYMCLSLGFEGRLRVEQGGADRHQTIRAGLAKIIRGQRGPTERALSPHWEGVDKPHRSLSAWKPFWVSLASVAALLGAGYLGLNWSLRGQTGPLLGEIAVLDGTAPATLLRRAPPVAPPPPPPPEVAQESPVVQVADFLKPEVEEGLITVTQKGNLVTILIAGKGMFKPGSDTLEKAFLAPLDRVAQALKESGGPVLVVGHTDSVPTGATSRFASNTELSLARAEKVREKMAEVLGPDRPLTAEGRGEAEPLVDNDTPENRARNRRIEIVLVREQST
jgi:type VI secretion system protein ImpK